MSGRQANSQSPLRLRSLGFRLVLPTVALVAGAMLAAGTGAWLVLTLFAQRDLAQFLDVRATTLVADVKASSADRLTVRPDDLAPGEAVFTASGQLVAGTVDRRAVPVVEQLVGQGVDVTAPAGDELVVRVRPFTTPAGDTAMAVVTQETAPYERAELYAVLAMLGLGLLAVALTSLMARRVTTRALAPVGVMAERASDWSEHNLHQRFGLGPPTNELEALAETFDHLLDRVAWAIRSEQRLTSELAHELRTPLTSIRGSAELALMRGVDDDVLREDLEQIRDSAAAMGSTITDLLDIARDLASVEAGETCSVDEVLARTRHLVGDRQQLVDATRGDRARIAAPLSLVMRALAPLVDNAVQYARSEVRLSASVSSSAVTIEVSDDGPGVEVDLRHSLFEPGRSGSGGTGLGLAISRRVARTLGGEVRLVDTRFGASFALDVPRA